MNVTELAAGEISSVQEMDEQPRKSTAATDTVGESLNPIATIAGVILILGLGIGGVLVFGRKPEVATDNSSLSAALEAPLVDIADVLAWDQPFHLDIDGEAATYRVLTVGAEVTGRVALKSANTRSGSFVNKGDVLFEIDPVNYELELQRLQARVDQSRAELVAVDVAIENTKSLLQLASEENQLQKSHLERVRSLFERKATSESEMDTASRQELTSRNAMQTQENQLNTLLQDKKTKEAALKLAEAELERAQIDLKRCIIQAPITGRIVDDIKEEGDYVKPGDDLVHVSDSARMEIKCSLKSEELAWVWQQGLIQDTPPIATSASTNELAETPAAADANRIADPFKIPQVPCEIVFNFQGVETIWDGKMSRYEGTGMDRETRMFPCRVIVEDPGKTRVEGAGITRVAPPTLLSGMYVTVRIPIKSRVPLLQVPAVAIRPGQQLWLVRDGKLQIIDVMLARIFETSALVQQHEDSVLRVGDKVVISPLASVTNGMAVTVQTPADASNAPTTTTPAPNAAGNSVEVSQ